MYIDNTKFVGRTLEDILPDLPKVAKGEHYFVGSKSAYFICFDKVDGFAEKAKQAEGQLIARAIHHKEKNERQLPLLRKPKRMPKETDENFDKRVKSYQTRKAVIERQIEIWKDYLDGFKPIAQRTVVEVFVRNGLDRSCCIFVEGEEPGFFIDFEDYKKFAEKVKWKPKEPKPKKPKVEKVAEKVKPGVYLGRLKPISKLKDATYDAPYEGTLPKGLSKMYRNYVDGKTTLALLSQVSRVPKHTLRLLFYKIQTGEIEI
jgi:hypothetical protein